MIRLKYQPRVWNQIWLAEMARQIARLPKQAHNPRRDLLESRIKYLPPTWRKIYAFECDGSNEWLASFCCRLGI